ncbi:piwi-like protein [Anaeramoeba flamelloides]|uniref:Piwi-like protein n=1 Tax=Anaeramoeba flamelloides TaxID=1746091 RepID=A0ABQ8XRL6_9EUKA|nr:piwi-like protein [Anaeramoeba flamelloides]
MINNAYFPKPRIGKNGRKVTLLTNYFPIKFDLDTVFLNEIKFEPEIRPKRPRWGIFSLLQKELPDCLFDGFAIVYSMKEINDIEKEITYRRRKFRVTLKKVKLLKTIENWKEFEHLYNIIFARIMKTLGLQQMRNRYYDAENAIQNQQYHFELWRGYYHNVSMTKMGSCLNLDLIHKVVRTDTVLDNFHEVASSFNQRFNRRFQQNSRDRYQQDNRNQNRTNIDYTDEKFRSILRKDLIGQVVMTRYNNRSYIINDIDFEKNPSFEFQNKENKTVSLFEYYRNVYHKNITDRNQPLLVLKKFRTDREGNKIQEFSYLIPELCSMTGLTNRMRENFYLMQEISRHTQIRPENRLLELKKFVHRILTTEKAALEMKKWRMYLKSDLITVPGRVLNQVNIQFRNRNCKSGDKGNWTYIIKRAKPIRAKQFRKWLIIYPQSKANEVSNFVDTLKITGGQMGIEFMKPKMIGLRQDTAEEYCRHIHNEVDPQVDLSICVLFSADSNKYNSIKQQMSSERPVPNQCVLINTLRKKRNFNAVCQKIVLQVNCKAGGAIWNVDLPRDEQRNIMYVGIATSFSSNRKKNSMVGCVATTSNDCTDYYTNVFEITRQKPIENQLTSFIKNALDKYFTNNKNKPPRNIIVYRDGISDSQFINCIETEIPQFYKAFKMCSEEYKPELTWVVAQKRIKTRYFNNSQNPMPGSIIDSVITKPNRFDFFLVPQHVNQGSATPVHYQCIYDNSKIPGDTLIEITYKLCHMYYNWTGTVRVPMVIQYAQKAAFLAYQSTKQESNHILHDKLYYL